MRVKPSKAPAATFSHLFSEAGTTGKKPGSLRRTLTKRNLEAMKPPATGQIDIYDLGGPPGFHVRISRGGTKTFYLWYRRNGKSGRWKIGRFPSWSLADARTEAKRIESNRADPIAEAEEELKKAAAEQRRAGTFLRLMALYFQKNRRRLKPKTLKEWLRIAKKELRPEFGAMAPAEITRGDIRAFLERKAERAPYMANRVHEVIRVVFAWGVETERISATPCVGLKKLGVEKERERVLSTEELRAVLHALEPQQGEDGTLRQESLAPFFWLVLYTAARKTEALSIGWQDIDWEKSLVTFPNTKQGRAHVLPLSEPALRLLRALAAESKTSKYVFPGVEGRPLLNPNKAVARLRHASGVSFRLHDLRRTAATRLAELGIARDVISAILGHVQAGPEATRIYDRYHRIPEMRKALERWALELERIQTGGKSADIVSMVRS